MSRALSFREAAFLVARREFIQRARDRSFFVSTAITIGIIGLVIVFPKALNFGADEYTVAFVGPEGPAHPKPSNRGRWRREKDDARSGVYRENRAAPQCPCGPEGAFAANRRRAQDTGWRRKIPLGCRLRE